MTQRACTPLHDAASHKLKSVVNSSVKGRCTSFIWCVYACHKVQDRGHDGDEGHGVPHAIVLAHEIEPEAIAVPAGKFADGLTMGFTS